LTEPDLLLHRRARRAYEVGRARGALLRALAVAAVAALAAWIVVGPRALPWLPLTFAFAAFAEWRGGPLARGARRGLLAGLVTLMLPLSLLRPCCGGDPSMTCTMPSVCAAAGAIFGLSLAVFLPSAPTFGGRLRGAAGMALGVGALAAMRCAALFYGEALGLVGGLAAGVTAAGLARAWIDSRRGSAASS
jgi:hypothetical protein